MTEKVNRDALIVLSLLLYVSFVISYGVYYAAIEFVDLPTFYVAVQAAFNLQVSPYLSQPETLTKAFGEQTVFPFLYPPPSLLLLFPYALVSYQLAGTMTLIINHFLILIFLYLFLFRILGLRFYQPFLTLAIALTLLYHPLIVTLNRGQVNLLVLVMICLTWYAFKRHWHPAAYALPLAIAILVKMYPALFLLYFLVKRQFRAIFWTLGYLASFSIVAFLVLPDQLWLTWIRYVLPTGGYAKVPLNLFSPAAPWNQSINGFTARLFLPNEFSDPLFPSLTTAIIVPYVLAAIVVFISLGLVYKISRSSMVTRDTFIDLEFSLMLTVMYLVAPISWEHHLVLILPAVIIALNRVLISVPRTTIHYAAAIAILLTAWRFPFWAGILKQGVLTFGISLKFYAVVCIWTFIILELSHAVRSQRVGPQSIQPGSSPASSS